MTNFFYSDVVKNVFKIIDEVIKSQKCSIGQYMTVANCAALALLMVNGNRPGSPFFIKPHMYHGRKPVYFNLDNETAMLLENQEECHTKPDENTQPSGFTILVRGHHGRSKTGAPIVHWIPAEVIAPLVSRFEKVIKIFFKSRPNVNIGHNSFLFLNSKGGRLERI